MRTAVVEATKEFVYWEVFERKAEPDAKTQKLIEVYKKTAGDLQHAMLAGGASDAGRYARHLIRKHFQDPRLSGTIDCIYSLSGVLTSFQSACVNALMELEPPSTLGLLGDLGALPSFKEGEAWDLWIRRLSKILREHGLRTGARKDSDKSDEQSPFTLLVRELQRCLPTECKLPYSESALPTAIATARRRPPRLSSIIRSAKSGTKRPPAKAG